MKREEKIITQAVAASKAAEKKPVEGTGSTAVGVTGGKPDKASAAGPKPNPEDKQFTAVVTEPSQVGGAFDNLEKQMMKWLDRQLKAEQQAEATNALNKQINTKKQETDAEIKAAKDEATEKQAKQKEIAQNQARIDAAAKKAEEVKK